MNRVVVGLVAVLSSFTVLHSGRTDGNGGHYNHSTGEYHYHHGYSAHDHYDMNGDGIVDCPYKFKDNTSNKSNQSDKSNTSKSENKTNNTTDKSVKKQENKTSFRDVIEIILVVAIFSPLAYSAMLLMVLIAADLIERFAKKYSDKDLDILTSDKFHKTTKIVIGIIAVVSVLVVMLHAEGFI